MKEGQELLYQNHEDALIKFFGKCEQYGFDFNIFMEVIKEKYFPEPSFMTQLERIHNNAKLRIRQLNEKEKGNGGNEKSETTSIEIK